MDWALQFFIKWKPNDAFKRWYTDYYRANRHLRISSLYMHHPNKSKYLRKITICQSQKHNYSAFLNLSFRVFFFLDRNK